MAEDITPAQAENRLRACVISGATTTTHASWQAAVISVRTLCRPQLNRVYRNSDAAIDAGAAGAGSSELDEQRKRARRQIDARVAWLVASATGLGQ